MEKLNLLLSNLPAIDGDWTQWKMQIAECLSEMEAAKHSAEEARDAMEAELLAAQTAGLELETRLNEAEADRARLSQEVETMTAAALLSQSLPEPLQGATPEPEVIPEPEPEVIPEPEPIIEVPEPVAERKRPLLL